MRITVRSLFAAPIAACALVAASVPAASQIAAPKAAPSTPVETIALAPFEPTREDAVLEGYVDGVVSAFMRAHDTPGVAVSVVRDGRTVFAKGYGVADLETDEAVDGRETLFRIGSVSKTFVWTSVMMLAERGLIDLDADVNAYLKDIEIPDAFDAPVTLNHLMAHRAGFEDTFAVFVPRDGEEILDAQAMRRDMPKRVYPPGARTSYSNWGSALAAKIVEDVAGVPYREFLATEILAPLAMADTTMFGPAEMPERFRARLSSGFKIERGAPAEAEFMRIGAYAPAGAMASTAEDMARWMQFHLGSGRLAEAQILSEDSHRQLWTRAFADRPAGADLAHGFMTKPYRELTLIGHAGATAAFLANMMMAPELGVGVFVSQNAGQDRSLVMALPELVVDHLLDARASPPPTRASTSDDAASDPADFVGRYLQNRRSFSTFEKLFALNATAQITPGEGGSIVVASGGDVSMFAPIRRDVFEDRNGGRLAFERDGKGRVTHYTGPLGVHSWEKIGLLDSPTLFNLGFGAAAVFAFSTWMGAWRRGIGASRETGAGRALGVMSFAAATAVLALVGSVAWVTAAFASASAADLADYPQSPIVVFRLLALAATAAAAAMLVGLWPVWRVADWSVWRRGHYTLFAIALGLLAFVLARWNVVFAPTI